jgi:glycosyltransferase involved in cell wall biosynthesis
VRIGLLTTSYPRSPGDPAGGFVAEHAAFLARAGHDVEVIAAGGAHDPAPDVEMAAGIAADAARDVDVADPEAIAADTAHASADAIASTRTAPSRTDDAPSPGRIHLSRVAAARGLFDRSGAPEELARSPRAWLSAAGFTVALARAAAARAPAWDAVVAHWLVPSGLAALAGAPGLPILAIAHSGDVHLLRRLRALRAMGALCDRPDLRLSFVSEQLRRMFLEPAPRCARLSQVCPMGVDVSRLRAARERERVRTAAPAAPTVLFLGRLVPVKGVHHLVRAASLWRSNARLVIAGAGPSEPELRRMVAAAPPGRISFAGEVRGAERDRAVAAADVVVLPSVRVEGGRSEGLPLVALEAMAAGAALVASAVGGLADLPAGAVTHVQPADPAGLAAAVDALVLDAARRAAQVRAQDRFIPDFDWSSVGPRLLPPVRLRAPERRSPLGTASLWGEAFARLAKTFSRTPRRSVVTQCDVFPPDLHSTAVHG